MKKLLLLVLCLSLSLGCYSQIAPSRKKESKRQPAQKSRRNRNSAPIFLTAKATEGIIQWASGVVEVSSEKTRKANSASKVLGTPNALPQGGDHPDAWEPLEGKTEFIIVRFDRPAPASQITILENYNPGAITAVTAYDSSGNSHVLATYKAAPPKEKTRILHITMRNTSYAIHRIRLDINTTLTSENPQIDGIGMSERASDVELIRLPPDLDITSKAERLSDEINSQTAEIGPVISSDGRTLYFSRAYHPANTGGVEDREDIWVSSARPNGSWGPPTNMGPPLNNADANFISSVTPDNNVFLLGNVYGPKGGMKAGASISVREPAGSFSKPRVIDIKNDQNFSDQVDYILSNSGTTMIIAEERESSLGQRDLYASFLQEDSAWSEPISLGNVVNTASDDFSPFLAADDRSLYFSTSGRPSFGLADIFLTRRIGDGWQTWTEPQNLGSIINGAGKDSYFTLPASGNFAYYASAGTSKEETDIYRIILPKSQRPTPVVLVSGTVVDSKSGLPLDAEIVYEDLSTGKKVGVARTNPKTGKYQIALPGGQNFGYVAKSKESESFGISSNLDLKKLRAYKEIKQDLVVAKQEVGAVVRLNNLFFDFNKSELKMESFPELNRMIAYMKQFPKLTMEIAGHTDSVGANAFNYKLSGARSGSVVQYLTQKGVAKDRLKVKAFGETKPQAPNKTEDGRAINRRVEFVVLQRGVN
jgi:OmpA-OmpF porin, OOP family